uniref:Cyclic nucleotide-binding domain-containing protein n=1 Tax=Meloidogyne enterolobii TaxID=390850 RepID=A0A6V7VFQ2_MELEN|nr:unnamed protein product [Meloidogyne enterolobii]
MYRNSLPNFKKSSNSRNGFKVRTQQRIGNISNLLNQINTDVLSLNNYSSSDSLASIPPNTVRSISPPLSTASLHHRRPQSVFNQQLPPSTSRSINTLPGEITGGNISSSPPLTIFEENKMKEINKEDLNNLEEKKEEKEENINEDKTVNVENEEKNSTQSPLPSPSNKNIETTKIIVEQADSISFEEKNNLLLESPPIPSPFLRSPSPSPALLSSSSPFSFSSQNLSDNSSQMSFIIREKLHEFAKDLRRRTSAVREELCREPTPTDEQAEEDEDEDKDEKRRKSGERRPDQASLMSLIGLHQEVESDEIVDVPSRLLPSNIDPFSKLYVSWLSFVLIAFLYNSFVIPLRCSYPYQTRSNLRYWLFGDYICDLIYLVDLTLIKSRLTFMRDGINVKSPPEMLHHYLTSGVFKLDLFSLLPLDILYIWTGPICAWRIFRLLKLPSFWEFFELLDSSFSNPYAIRIAKTFCYMIYIIHCNSCVYYVLSAWQGFGQIPYNYKGKWYLNKWVYNNEGNAYIRCFYFTAAVATSTGNNPAPTNVIEYIYMTFSWMMGVFVFALLLGQIRDIVSNANKNNEEFRTTMDRALSECKRLGLPEHLTARVRAWFLYTWEQQRTLEEKRLVEKLPLKLQTDLALSVHYNTLSKVKLFQDADRAFMRDLVLRLRPVIFLPGDIICRKGDVGKEMYIVNNGILEVVGGENNEIVFATLTEGSVFGEISLLAIGGNNRRTANIRSKGYSTLFVLSKEDLNDVIKDYPDAQQLLKKKARQMLRKDEKGKKGAEESKKNLIERCRVSCDLRTPRMLSAVAQLLPSKSKTVKQLLEQPEIKEDKQKKKYLKRWSTIPYEFSDASDIMEERKRRQPLSDRKEKIN